MIFFIKAKAVYPIVFILFCIQISAETVSLEQALRNTVLHNSRLEIERSELEIKQLEIDISRRWSNPHLELNVENINSGSESNPLEREEEIRFSQKIEPFGKRKAKTALADADKQLAQEEYSRLKASLLLETSQRFHVLLMHRKKIANANQNLQFIENSLNMSEDLYEAGKIPLSDLRRTKLEVMTFQLEIVKEERDAKKASLHLQNLWDQRDVTEIELEGDWVFMDEPLKKLDMQQLRLQNPDLLKMGKGIYRENQVLNVQKKSRFPEMALMAGAKKTSGTNQTGIQVGVEVEIPVFNSGKPGVAKSRIKLQQKKMEMSYHESTLATELDRLYIEIQLTHEIISSLKTEMLPLAELELETLRLSYKMGKHSYLNVLDRMNIVFDLKRQIIDHSFQYMLYLSEIQYLSGMFSK